MCPFRLVMLCYDPLRKQVSSSPLAPPPRRTITLPLEQVLTMLVKMHGWEPVSLASRAFAQMYIMGVQAKDAVMPVSQPTFYSTPSRGRTVGSLLAAGEARALSLWPGGGYKAGGA